MASLISTVWRTALGTSSVKGQWLGEGMYGNAGRKKSAAQSVTHHTMSVAQLGEPFQRCRVLLLAFTPQFLSLPPADIRYGHTPAAQRAFAVSKAAALGWPSNGEKGRGGREEGDGARQDTDNAYRPRFPFCLLNSICLQDPGRRKAVEVLPLAVNPLQGHARAAVR